ncbi:hypothetical protein DFQ29_009446 [Apophysomyces sp. BC1021]|nr:hypothetical protein DFQ29_009446 [Apophysomyces sp. BC1021]
MDTADHIKRLVFEHTITEFINDRTQPQVAKLSVVGTELKYQAREAYLDVRQNYDTLSAYIRQNPTGTSSTSKFWASDWTWELLYGREYHCDPRQQEGLLPRLQLLCGDMDMLIIIFPPDYGLARLSNEINDRYDVNNEDDDHNDMGIYHETLMLRRRWPQKNLDVEMYGSAINGLGNAESDLDLCIVVPHEVFEEDLLFMSRLRGDQGSLYNMRYLADMLRSIGMVGVLAIPSASVPICKFRDGMFDIHCDINVNDRLGVENSRFINAYTNLDDRVAPFLCAIKDFVKKFNINDASRGSLSSYCYSLMGLWFLIWKKVIPNLQNIAELTNNKCRIVDCASKRIEPTIMIQKKIYCVTPVKYHDCVEVQHNGDPDDEVAHIIHTPTRTIWKGNNTKQVGLLLVEFLQYFGTLFDYTNQAVCLRTGTLAYNEWHGKLAVRDPFILERNAAASCNPRTFMIIQALFRKAFQDLSHQDAALEKYFTPYSSRDNFVETSYQVKESRPVYYDDSSDDYEEEDQLSHFTGHVETVDYDGYPVVDDPYGRKRY